jgi:endonuclease/exonuclease/phosphatase (EEP) superfamily protein YafD
MMNREQADVYCLQEIRNLKTAERISRKTGYEFIISSGWRAFYRMKLHTAIFTNMQKDNHGELDFTKTRRVYGNHFGGKALWVNLKIGKKIIRIYSCHLSPTGLSIEKRLSVLEEILNHSQKFHGPILIGGDMNTTLPEKGKGTRLIRWWSRIPRVDIVKNRGKFRQNEKHAFYEQLKSSGFEESLSLDKNTWVLPYTKKEMFKLKLDWLIYKNLDKISAKLGPIIGDHKSIIGEFMIN